MRIISGTHGGIRLMAPNNLPVRPTTDLAKEALFNILQNRFDFSEISCLDLFSGTGNIAYELISRGCEDVTAVDQHSGCCKFIEATAIKLKMEGLNVIRANVFKFLTSDPGSYDLIFADPPYDLASIPDISTLVFSNNLLKPGGCLVVEHASQLKLNEQPHFKEVRKYGQSTFSIFVYPNVIV